MRRLLLLSAALGVVLSAQTASYEGPTRASGGRATKNSGRRQATVARDVDHVFPYVLSSSSWATTFVITNLEDHEVSVFCEFVAPDGTSRPMTFDFDPANPTAFTKSTIAPLATATFKTVSSSATLSTVWTYCAAEPASERFSGYAIVRNTASNGAMREFVTLMQPDSEPVFSIPFGPIAENTTGLVLLNASTDTETKIALWLVDPAGKQLDVRSVTLPAGALRVLVLNDLYKDLEIKEGTVRAVVVEGSKWVTGLGLRTSAAGYAALAPLAPKADPPPPENQ